LCAVVVYALTAYPAITWWDSAEYSLAALTMGITPPPGSLLLTILGWLVTRLPLGGAPALALNALAGVLAATTACLVYRIALRLFRDPAVRPAPSPPANAAAVGAALGALAFAFSRTFWEYATQFTPYILTTVFTGLILWGMIRWREAADDCAAWRWFLLLGVFFGLDFSVHRTNLLLLPGLLVWILLNHPRTFLSPRAWISGVTGMVLGLAFHLSVIPISANRPALNIGEPSNWSRFYEYVSLQQMGGGWLVKFFPRKSPVWPTQVLDLVRAFCDTFCATGGKAGVVGLLPALFGFIGVVILWLRSRRVAVAILALLFVHVMATILYFNIPASFFRSLYRHYLPVFVVFAVLVSYGMGSVSRIAWDAWRSRRRPVAVLAGLLVAIVPVSQLLRNLNAVDASRAYFTEDFAANMLAGLPDHAILFTNGDNDTWPMLYMQAAYGIRPDVQILNLSLLNLSWFVDQVVERDPEFPLSLTEEERHALSFREWPDTTVSVPVSGSPAQYGLPDSPKLPEAISIRAPAIVAEKYVRPQDQILLDIFTASRWRRPLCIAVTVPDQNRAWLAPYCRLDGLFWRVVPCADPPENPLILRENLFSRYRYRGYADSAVRLDGVSRRMALNYYPAFIALAKSHYQSGDSLACAQTRAQVASLLPLARLEPGQDLRNEIERLCTPHSGSAGP
jgi:hypothetical protein